jgi:hypothetical protein
MFSKELENLIKASLTDGKLSELEKNALVKRAQKEGVDLDELEIYIESILQQRTQEQKVQLEKETSEHEKLRKGNICPHCATELPPLTKICPNCNRAVNTNETSGDKELFELIDQVNAALVEVKSVKSIDDYRRAAAECEALINKANVFYGDNKKVQMLVYELKVEIEKAEKGAKKAALRNQLGKRWKLIVGVVIGLIVIILLLSIKTPDQKIDAQTKKVSAQVTKYINENDIASANDLVIELVIPDQDNGTDYIVKKYDAIYLKVVTANVKNADLDSAEEVALAYRGKISNDLSWQESSVYTYLKSAFLKNGRSIDSFKSGYDFD